VIKDEKQKQFSLQQIGSSYNISTREARGISAIDSQKLYLLVGLEELLPKIRVVWEYIYHIFKDLLKRFVVSISDAQEQFWQMPVYEQENTPRRKLPTSIIAKEGVVFMNSLKNGS
jgi:hypothetical protein